MNAVLRKPFAARRGELAGFAADLAQSRERIESAFLGVGSALAESAGLLNQITQTFATVAQSDRSWTEKVCAMAAPKDGSLQLAFGMGKYPNRGVLDAYAGVSRGVEQWTVRSSRKLWPAVEDLAVGPIGYEVLEPLRSVRFSLEPNDVVPVSFEWTFTGVVPPVLEDHEQHRSRDGSVANIRPRLPRKPQRRGNGGGR